MRLAGAAGPRDGGGSHDDQPGAAGGPLLVVGLRFLAAGTVGSAKVFAHRRHDDAVLQLQLADAAGLQKRCVRVAHGVVVLVVCSLAHPVIRPVAARDVLIGRSAV
ncbi:hypothetical protein SDC9_181925 [bioreactor metagenome]|uniref:Uncharacterized protein n=1 Tax=bioreactor metagenome TaxID=1076179 RepID=A0A645H7T6_9ZZZZ